MSGREYAQLTITVTNMMPGEQFAMNLQSATPGQNAYWSMGASVGGGISLSPFPGTPVLLSQFSVTASQIVVETASTMGGADEVGFSVAIDIRATSGLKSITLSAICDPTVSVTAGFSNCPPHPITMTPTELPWP